VPTAAAKRERSEPIPYDLSPLPDAESVQAAERACGGADLARECVRAAVAYASGAVVARNQKKVGIYNHRAHQLFEQACERRDAEACYALAWLYANGRGVMRSGEVAMNMFVRTLGLCRTRRQAICERLGETPP
jgi:TPR repeat protein